MQVAFCTVNTCILFVFTLCVTIRTMSFFFFFFSFVCLLAFVFVFYVLRKPEPLDVLVPYDNHSSLLEFLIVFSFVMAWRK